jgi:hypothetical protein
MNVNEDRASGVLNSPTNHTGGGLREHKRRHGKIQKNPEDQVPLHLSPSSHGVVRDAEKAVNRPRRMARQAARNPSVERHAETLHGPEQERARATLDGEVPVLFFDRFRRLQAEKEIILQHSLSLAMLAGNGRWSETEVSHNFVVTYI